MSTNGTVNWSLVKFVGSESGLCFRLGYNPSNVLRNKGGQDLPEGAKPPTDQAAIQSPTPVTGFQKDREPLIFSPLSSPKV